jgi:hypothetical protein
LLFFSSLYRCFRIKTLNSSTIVGVSSTSFRYEDTASGSEVSYQATVSYIQASAQNLTLIAPTNASTSSMALNQAVFVASLLSTVPSQPVSANTSEPSVSDIRNQVVDVILNVTTGIIQSASSSKTNGPEVALDSLKIINALEVVNAPLSSPSNSSDAPTSALDSSRVAKSAQVLTQLLEYAGSPGSGADDSKNGTARTTPQTNADVDALVAAAIKLLDSMARNARVALDTPPSPPTQNSTASNNTQTAPLQVGQAVMDAAEAAARVSASGGSACAGGSSLVVLDRVRLSVANADDAAKNGSKPDGGDGLLKLTRIQNTPSAKSSSDCVVQWMVRVDVEFDQTMFDFRGCVHVFLESMNCNGAEIVFSFLQSPVQHLGPGYHCAWFCSFRRGLSSGNGL